MAKSRVHLFFRKQLRADRCEFSRQVGRDRHRSHKLARTALEQTIGESSGRRTDIHRNLIAHIDFEESVRLPILIHRGRRNERGAVAIITLGSTKIDGFCATCSPMRTWPAMIARCAARGLDKVRARRSLIEPDLFHSLLMEGRPPCRPGRAERVPLFQSFPSRSTKLRRALQLLFRGAERRQQSDRFPYISR